MLDDARLIRATLALWLCLLTVTPALAQTTASSSAPASSYAAILRTINPHLALQTSLTYARALLEAAARWHLDPALVMALVTIESRWNPHAVSVDGAEGLGQLIPSTAHRLGVDPFSVHGNLRGTTAYLHRLLGLFRSAREPMREALAGYNLGPLTVQRYGGMPPYASTQRYVGSIMREWKTLRKRVIARTKSRRQIAAVPPLDDPAGDQRYWGL